jgi:hypothetical protein
LQFAEAVVVSTVILLPGALGAPIRRPKTVKGDFRNPPLFIGRPRWGLRLRAANYGLLAGALVYAGPNLHGLSGALMLALAVVFAGCALYGLRRLVRRDGLEIGPEGLRRIRRGKGALVCWDEVGNFRVYGSGPDRMVIFDLADGATTNSTLQDLADEPEGEPGSLDGRYEISAERVAELLNGASRRWGRGYFAAEQTS